MCLLTKITLQSQHSLFYEDGYDLYHSLDRCIFVDSLLRTKQVYQRLDWKKETVIPYAKCISPNILLIHST